VATESKETNITDAATRISTTPSLLSMTILAIIADVRKIVAKNSKQKLWLFVLYLFDPKFLKMASGTHNVATNQINRSHCAERTRW
jgi:hypothetical protein